MGGSHCPRQVPRAAPVPCVTASAPHPLPRVLGQQAAGLPLGLAKMVGNGIVGAGIAVPCHTGAVGLLEWALPCWAVLVQHPAVGGLMARRGWQREVHAGAQIYTALCILSVGPTELCVGGCSVPGGPGAALTAVSAHSYRTLATEHEALMQKYLHLLQIVETEKTVAKQLRQQIEDGEIEIERLKAEVRGGPGSAGTAPGADVGVVSHVAAGGAVLGWAGECWVEKWILGRDGGSQPLHSAC